MNTEKLTAVEWLGNEWFYLDQQFDMCLIDRNIYLDKLRQIQEQAKEMENEQNNAKIQKAIELFEQVKIQSDTDKDVTYLDNVLAVLYGIKNTN